MLPALAFVPLEDVESSFEKLISSIDFPEVSQCVVDYFEDCWIGRPMKGQRRKPKFPINIWNCNNSVKSDLPRTNNAVEGWHRSFNSSIGIHPSLWKFIDLIKLEQSKNELILNQIYGGVDVPHKKQIYKNMDTKLKRIVSNFNKDDLLNFLKGISSTFNF